MNDILDVEERQPEKDHAKLAYRYFLYALGFFSLLSLFTIFVRLNDRGESPLFHLIILIVLLLLFMLFSFYLRIFIFFIGSVLAAMGFHKNLRSFFLKESPSLQKYFGLLANCFLLVLGFLSILDFFLHWIRK